MRALSPGTPPPTRTKRSSSPGTPPALRAKSPATPPNRAARALSPGTPPNRADKVLPIFALPDPVTATRKHGLSYAAKSPRSQLENSNVELKLEVKGLRQELAATAAEYRRLAELLQHTDCPTSLPKLPCGSTDTSSPCTPPFRPLATNMDGKQAFDGKGTPSTPTYKGSSTGFVGTPPPKNGMVIESMAGSSTGFVGTPPPKNGSSATPPSSTGIVGTPPPKGGSCSMQGTPVTPPSRAVFSSPFQGHGMTPFTPPVRSNSMSIPPGGVNKTPPKAPVKRKLDMDTAINRNDADGVAALLADDIILCSVPLRDGSGERPLVRAACMASPAIIRLLLEAGATPDDCDKDGRTALIALCEAPSPTTPSWFQMISFTEEFEGFQFCENLKLETDEKSRIEVAMILLQAGANVDHVDAKGEKAEHAAARLERHTLANYLSNWTSCVYFWREWCIQQKTKPSKYDQLVLGRELSEIEKVWRERGEDTIAPLAMLPEGIVSNISQFLLPRSLPGPSFLKGKF